MSDVIAIFGLLFITSLAFPGLLVAWALLFPNVVERARDRVEHTPWTTFGMGIAGLIGAVIPITILLALPFAPAKFFGWVSILATLTFASLGASGIAAQMGRQITYQVKSEMSEFNSFVWGTVTFELAAAFPILGWLIVTPLWIITSMGAAIFGILNWMPKKHLRPTAQNPLEPSHLQVNS